MLVFVSILFLHTKPFVSPLPYNYLVSLLLYALLFLFFFFFQAEDGIRDGTVTGVQTLCSSDLGQITAHDDAHEFCIFDPLTNRKIHCFFPLEDLGAVRDALTLRVLVSGLIAYRRKDDAPLTVDRKSVV